ncbi:MAG: LarC family nickel insertion protein [Endomicrobiia bacterium]|nr:LarC family nickel insertion protein [Endomicrobiia bacterium]
MKILHLNLSNGIAGDMILAALVSAGVPKKILEKFLEPLSRLGVDAPHAQFVRVEKSGLPALSVSVPGDFHFENPSHIARVIKKLTASRSSGGISAGTAAAARKTALGALDLLVSAESRAHKIHRSRVHFHELNSKDTLIDILGSAFALAYLAPDKIIATPVNIGRANPAALSILKTAGIPVYSDEPSRELATPTGAAILAAFSPSFENLPAVEVISFGGGAGSSVIPGRDNILRVIVGQTETHSPHFGRNNFSNTAPLQPVILVETNIDDMNPELYPSVQRRLIESGALDVWLENIIMKHGRPAVKLCCLARPADIERVSFFILKNTTSSGVRFVSYSRVSLPRRQSAVMKKYRLPDGKIRIKPERRFRRP